MGRRRAERLHLQTAYGNALIAARGYGAPETIEAFAKARESAYGDKDAPERFAADYGLCVGSLHARRAASGKGVRGDIAQRTWRIDPIRPRPASPIAPPGSRVGSPENTREARDHLERALALFQPGRDDDLAFRFGQDPGVAAMIYLALVLWPLGEVERAVSLARGC